MKQAGVTSTLVRPEGTQHGFNNDTTPRFDEAVAKQAWDAALALFDFFFQAEDGIRDGTVTGVQTCALPICARFYECITEDRELLRGHRREHLIDHQLHIL